MARRISMGTRAELLAAVGERYRSSGRDERSRILDEFVAITGYHRKHAIRLLTDGAEDTGQRGERPGRRPRYGDAVRDTLVALWEASDRICGKRLRPLIPVLLPALERHGEVTLDAETRGLVLGISAATIDRLLAEVRLVAAGGRRRAAGFSSAVRRSVPVRTFGDWGDPTPGYVEADFVAHSGPSAAGPFVQTLVLTDVATGWTECMPLVLKEASLVVEAIGAARSRFPFPLRGVDFDNDSLFMNEVVVGWCRAEGLEVTRSRAYRKNDQAWVEQKNGAIVRRAVGYGRLEGLGAAEALGRLYGAARLHGNLFQPSFKLREKRREGARVIKRYHPPVAPVARVLAHPAVAEEDKARLRTLLAATDPVVAMADIRAAQAELGKRVDARGTGRPELPVRIDLAQFTASLKTAWKEGEQRPTHRRRYTRRNPLPPRPSMLDPMRDQILAWLEAEPDLSAMVALQRLLTSHPEQFRPEHLRTVQRFLRSRRAMMAREVLLGGPAAPLPTPAGVGSGASQPERDSLGPGSIST
jgi:hypothetical protein